MLATATANIYKRLDGNCEKRVGEKVGNGCKAAAGKNKQAQMPASLTHKLVVKWMKTEASERMQIPRESGIGEEVEAESEGQR